MGNVESEKVIVLEDGSICGNVTCKSIFISHGTEVIGKVNINKRAPYEIDTDFRVQGVAENVERYRVSNKDGSFPGPAIDPMLLEAPLPENSAAYNVDKEEDAVMADKLGICGRHKANPFPISSADNAAIISSPKFLINFLIRSL